MIVVLPLLPFLALLGLVALGGAGIYEGLVALAEHLGSAGPRAAGCAGDEQGFSARVR